MNIYQSISYRKDLSQLHFDDEPRHSSFSNIEITKSIPAPDYSVLQIRFKFKSPFLLLPQIRYLIKFRVESSIISNITYNILRKVINVQTEKCRTKNGALRTPALTGYSCEDFLSRTTKHSIIGKKRNKAKYLTRSSIGLKFVKKTSMSKTVESLEYIKCYSSSSSRPIKSPSNSVRYNCRKICS